MKKIKGLFLLICAAGVMLLVWTFSTGSDPLVVNMPRITPEMTEQVKAAKAAEDAERQNAEAARHRAEVTSKMYRCQNDDDCIIVDQDPCGCLKGPSGVTSINAEWSLEFSKLMDKKFKNTTTCPSKASTERECSDRAHAVCRSRRCAIAY